ncbi:MAG: phosphatidate cytidylyltransferase [Acidobacteria bacterium]|nr:phosphatidate cytidylyltransferase [Acidobacteriota bacterium]
MKTRIVTAAVALPVIIASIILPLWWQPGVWLFVGIAAVALSAGLFEFYSLTKQLQLKADAGMGYIWSAALFVGFVLDAPSRSPDLLFLTLAAFLICLLITQTFRFAKDFSKMLTGIGVTLLGVFYVAYLGGFLVATRMGFDPGLSTRLLGYFFTVIFSSDIGAYFAGRALGKHKLAPAISPGKTVEGLIGGLLFAAGGAAIVTATFFKELPFQWAIPLALVLATVGVLGDLAESAMKRGAGAKDAASILPGHGGFLDRLDSLLFGAPILYYFARFYFS